MQALERIVINTDWITILLVMLFICMCFLKGLDAKKLKGYAFSMLNKGFVENESEDKIVVFKLFDIVIFMFCVTIFSLICYYFLISYSESIYLFSSVFLLVFFYFLIKRVLEYLLSFVFLIRNEVCFFLISKSSYLYSICFYLFFCLVLVQYSKLNINFLIITTILFFLLRFSFHLANNKNLIFSKLFYFILYLCAFEIAPLFILFKLIF